MTLTATPAIQAMYDKLKRGGKLAARIATPPRNKAEIRKRVADFQAWRRQQSVPVYPTPERLAKEAIPMDHASMGGSSTQTPLRRYQSKSPVTQYQWGADIELAFAMYIRDAHTVDTVRVTVDYDAPGGGTPGRKLGGLGSVHDTHRDALERYLWVRDRLPDRFQKVADWLVLEVRSEASGKAMGWVEVGHALMPGLRDKQTAKGISIGALIMTGALLSALYRRFAIIHRAEVGTRPRVRVINEMEG